MPEDQGPVHFDHEDAGHDKALTGAASNIGAVAAPFVAAGPGEAHFLAVSGPKLGMGIDDGLTGTSKLGVAFKA